MRCNAEDTSQSVLVREAGSGLEVAVAVLELEAGRQTSDRTPHQVTLDVQIGEVSPA